MSALLFLPGCSTNTEYLCLSTFFPGQSLPVAYSVKVRRKTAPRCTVFESFLLFLKESNLEYFLCGLGSLTRYFYMWLWLKHILSVLMSHTSYYIICAS